MTGKDGNNGPRPALHEGESSTLLEQLYSRFQVPLQRYFRKRIYEKDEVDDLVQDVFQKLMSRSSSQPLENPESYIFQIAANLLRDRARRDIGRKIPARQFIEQHEDFFDEISPERVLLGKQRVATLHNALLELPERTRSVFLLHRFEELKYREIAHRLGVSVSSVEKHMMDALKHITFKLGKPE